MKLLLIICLSFVSISGFSVTYEIADSLEIRINSLIEKNNDNKISDPEKTELLRYIFKIQNNGFKLGDQAEYEQSIIKLDKAISLWQLINDKSSEANLRKYKATMLMKLGNAKEAEMEGYKSIELFGQAKFLPGVAVAQHDLSIVFDLEEKIDYALYYEIKSKAYYLSIHDSSRICANDIHLMNIYRKSTEYALATTLQENINSNLENLKGLDSILIDFYYVSYKLYEALGSNEKTKFYLDQYRNKLNDPQKKGHSTVSVYMQNN